MRRDLRHLAACVARIKGALTKQRNTVGSEGCSRRRERKGCRNETGYYGCRVTTLAAPHARVLNSEPVRT